MPRLAAALLFAAALLPQPASGQLPFAIAGSDSEPVEVPTPSGPVAGTRITTPHLTALVYPSTPTARARSTVSLHVDVTPEFDTYVYAPGAAGYRVITLTAKPTGSIRLKGRTRYPASELHHFKTFDEHTQIFKQAFRLTQDVEVDPEPAGRAGGPVTIAGVLDYQACSETICYEPVSLPISWTVEPPAKPAP